MNFREHFLIFPVLARCVEAGIITPDEVYLGLEAVPLSPFTSENNLLQWHIHFSALLWERKLLPPEKWHELQPDVLRCLDNGQGIIWFPTSFIMTLFRTIEAVTVPAVAEKLLQHSDSYAGERYFGFLAPRLSAAMWSEVWDTVRQMPSTQRQQKSADLEIIGPFVPDELVSAVFAEVMQLEGNDLFNPRVKVIAALAARLNDGDFRRALEYSRRRRDSRPGFNSGKMLLPLLQRLSEAEREVELKAIVPWALSDTYIDEDLIASIAPFLAGQNLRQVIEAVMKEDHPETQCSCMIALFPHLEYAERQRWIGYVLEQIPVVRGGTPDTIAEEHRLNVLNQLVPYLTESLSHIAVATDIVLKHFESPLERSRGLARLAEIAPETTRKELLEMALNAVLPSTVSGHTYQLGGQSGLIRLIPQLDDNLFEQAFETMMTVPDEPAMRWHPGRFDDKREQPIVVFEREQAHALEAMAVRLNREQLIRVLERMYLAV